MALKNTLEAVLPTSVSIVERVPRNLFKVGHGQDQCSRGLVCPPLQTDEEALEPPSLRVAGSCRKRTSTSAALSVMLMLNVHPASSSSSSAALLKSSSDNIIQSAKDSLLLTSEQASRPSYNRLISRSMIRNSSCWNSFFKCPLRPARKSREAAGFWLMTR